MGGEYDSDVLFMDDGIDSTVHLDISLSISPGSDQLTAFSEVESNAEVASSSSKILGLLTSALAMEIRCL
jgi:hypothetical protein